MGTKTTTYYRARYYDPSIGRFISEDPIGFKGSGTNFYAYVENDPTDSTDPYGLCGDCDVPRHPSDASVNQNMWLSIENGYIWWYQNVSAWGGPWDYKSRKGAPREWDDFGNFNYGATGCALGIPLDVLLRGAGWAKTRRSHSHKDGYWFWVPPYGNANDKQLQIINGYNYCQKCKLGLGVTN